MKITDVLIPAMTQCDLAWPSKKRALQNLSSLVSEHLGGDAEQADSLFHSFVAREKLGSTSIGDGVAIPHCRAAGFKRIHGCLITLQNPINFDAYDDQPVDLIFALVVPEEKNDEHLATLARIAALMQRDSSRQLLRACQNNEDLYNTAVRLERSN
ncbi:MAG: PTS sugar transporter subunit IIA [Porticoccaceae bacterium]|nr:PTS sugar transporter subunit IIA [Porticoccaceae bacterium]|tara:strand:+ start:1902 stop:2369 length:468 start_codon:yes stop_codon:yes gene_type:complete